jgi:hypothetical protein
LEQEGLARLNLPAPLAFNKVYGISPQKAFAGPLCGTLLGDDNKFGEINEFLIPE